jgi:hypothetical protein
MVIPKKRHGKMKFFALAVPLFAIASVPLSNSLTASALSVSDVLQVLNLAPKNNRENSGKSTTEHSGDAVRNNPAQTSQVAQLQTSNESQSDRSEANASSRVAESIMPAPKAPQPSARDEAAAGAVAGSAVDSLQVASEQAKKSVQPVAYSSSRIDITQRNELLRVSGITAAIAGIMYALSYAGVLWKLLYGESRQVRQTVTQQN